jgi:hypothetical protein
MSINEKNPANPSRVSSGRANAASASIRIGLALAALAPAALTAASCQEEELGDGTPGEMGRVSFGYDRSCFFTCPMEQPLLAGTREKISVDGPGDDRGVEPYTDEPKVAVFAVERDCFCEREDPDTQIEVAEGASCKNGFEKHCDNTILVEAGVAGEAVLELRDEDGEPVDRVTVIVREADRARFEASYLDRLEAMEGEAFELEVGETIDLEVTLYDYEGQKLLAPEGVTWRVEDDAVANVSTWLGGGGAEIHAGLSADVHGEAPGKTRLTVEVPGLEADVLITVAE